MSRTYRNGIRPTEEELQKALTWPWHKGKREEKLIALCNSDKMWWTSRCSNPDKWQKRHYHHTNRQQQAAEAYKAVMQLEEYDAQLYDLPYPYND